jgi:hypothetical protein
MNMRLSRKAAGRIARAGPRGGAGETAQYLADAHFIPLPGHVWVLSHDQIEEIR